MTFHKIDNPLPYPSTYTVDLYCDHENDEHGFRAFPYQIIGETSGECRKAARKLGWKLHGDGTATCPKCVARAKRELTNR